MVAFPTPALAATRSMHSPSGPDSANRLSAASMIAWSARSLRGRPGRRVPGAPDVPATASAVRIGLTLRPGRDPLAVAGHLRGAGYRLGDGGGLSDNGLAPAGAPPGHP